jgi:small-conductance mechanosensitive channel
MANIFSLLHHLPHVSAAFMIKACAMLALIIGLRLLIKALTPVIYNFCQKNNFESHTCLMMTKVVNYTICLIGAIIVLQNLGVDVSMLIAALGITGIVLSYGMKDIVANFIASILILGYKHVRINDEIKIDKWQGKVVDINLRYTTLKNENETIFVPNILLYTQSFSVVKNK